MVRLLKTNNYELKLDSCAVHQNSKLELIQNGIHGTVWRCLFVKHSRNCLLVIKDEHKWIDYHMPKTAMPMKICTIHSPFQTLYLVDVLQYQTLNFMSRTSSVNFRMLQTQGKQGMWFSWLFLEGQGNLLLTFLLLIFCRAIKFNGWFIEHSVLIKKERGKVIMREGGG